MKIETLLHFQYTNDATTYFVKVTEYSEMSNPESPSFVAMTTIDGEHVERARFATRTEAVQLAESKIKGFLARMHIIYNAD